MAWASIISELGYPKAIKSLSKKSEQSKVYTQEKNSSKNVKEMKIKIN